MAEVDKVENYELSNSYSRTLEKKSFALVDYRIHTN